MKAMEFYAHLLKGKEFKVVTDASIHPEGDTHTEGCQPYIHEWFESLAVTHKKGKENMNADAISRSTHLHEPTAETEDLMEEPVIVKFADR